MAIQIIDNFYLNTEKPIDNRIVVGGSNFYLNKNDITNKYPGLRIWDLNDNIPYVWNGMAWISENTLGITGSGTINYVSKFTSSNVIGNSQIFDNGTNVGIGTITPTNKLSVSGNVSANNFIGNGSQLTSLNINSSNVTGKIGLNNLPNGTNAHILQSLGSSTEWVAQNTLSVGNATTATNANNVNIQSTATNNNSHYMLFSTATGNQQIRTRTTDQSIRINPSTGNIGINTSSMNNNKLTVIGNVSIGTIVAAPPSGLRVQGSCVLSTVSSLAGVSIGTTTPAQSRGLRILGSGNYTDGNIVIQGNGGIATTAVHLDFDKIGSGIANPRFFRATNTTDARVVSFHRGDGTGTSDAQIGVGGTNTYFSTDPSSIFLIGSQFLTHTTGGNLGTDGNGVLQVTSKNSGVAIDGASFKPIDNTNHIINFVNTSGVNRGRIRGVSAATVVYETSSDLRLKKDITNMDSMIEKIKMLNPSNYKWKSDESNGFGFIAQEVYQVFPELRPIINSYCDTNCENFDLDNPVDQNGNPYYYGLDYGIFTPFLTKALQEVIQNYEDLIDKIKNSDSLDDLKRSL